MREVSISQAAALLGVSTDTIRRRIRRGELQARQDGRGRLLVLLADGEEAHALQPLEELVAELRRERDRLERELDDAKQTLRNALQAAENERRELRILLGNMQQQLQAVLPAPREERRSIERTERWVLVGLVALAGVAVVALVALLGALWRGW